MTCLFALRITVSDVTFFWRKFSSFEHDSGEAGLTWRKSDRTFGQKIVLCVSFDKILSQNEDFQKVK